MDVDSKIKKDSSAPLALVAGVFVAFCLGLFMSQPEVQQGLKPQENATYGGKLTEEPEIIPTSYQQVENGSIRPSQMQEKGLAQGRFLPPPEIVVMLKDKDEADRICDIFWKDKEGGRAAFQAKFASVPALKNVRLKRVTYSNEFVLEIENGSEKLDEVTKSKYSNVVKILKTLPSIAYAEPNVTAQTGMDK